MRIGDVLTLLHANTHTGLNDLNEQVYFSNPWRLFDEKELRRAYGSSTIFTWAVENIDEKTARQLHKQLLRGPAYLGMHAIDLSIPSHLVFYRLSLPAKYRIEGRSCQIFYDMGQREEIGNWEADELRKLGFDTVDYEDRGAHDTIFDDFDTPEHFACVEGFRKIVARYLEDNDKADELVLLVEDLSPRLFRALAACAGRLHQARNEEELAQAGLSVRRYSEQLADALFPPQSERRKGRNVGKHNIKNRLWAFVDAAIPDGSPSKDERVESLGKRIDNIIDEANSSLHANVGRKRVEALFVQLASVTFDLLALDPKAVRKPYYAFEESLTKFFRDHQQDAQQNPPPV